MPRILNLARRADRGVHHVKVDRTSIFGNPYHITPTCSRDEAVWRFEKYLKRRPELIKQVKEQLRGKNLACWCAPLNCHARVLMRIANSKWPT